MKDTWIKELRDDRVVQIKHVEGVRNPADILTKALPAYKHKLILNTIQTIRTPNETDIEPNPNPNPIQYLKNDATLIQLILAITLTLTMEQLILTLTLAL